jgi:PAS domain S-box-containing protein
VKVNKTLADYLDKKPEELIGKHCYKIIHGTSEPWQACPHSKTLETGESVTEEVDDPHFGCSLMVTTSPLFGENNELLGSIHIAKDITERKKYEESLQQSEERFKSIYSQSPIAIELYDSKGHLIDANDKCLELFGVDSAEEVKGFKLFEDPNLSDKAKADLKKGKSVRYEAPFDFELVKKLNLYNTSKSGVITLDVSIVPWATGERLPGYLVHVQDISERKEAEGVLHLQSEIAANASEGIYLVSVSDLSIVYANPKFEEMFGYGLGEIIGKHVSIINAHTDKNPVETANEIGAALERDGYWRGEVKNIKKDGTEFWGLSTISIFRHHEYGDVYLSIQRDITDYKNAEDAIKSSLKEKEALLQEIHHRVKNNLQVIVSLLDLQSEKISSEESLTSLMEVQGRIKAIALIHEQLYQSKDVALIDFNSFVKTLVDRIFQSFKPVSDNIKLKVDAKEVSLEIGQAISSGLIINELVTNALEHAFPDGRKGEIQVKIRGKSGNVEIIVRDNGVGFVNEFNFKKVKTLGLHLVKILSEDQLDGKLEMTNDKGTEFRINFKSDSDKE